MARFPTFDEYQDKPAKGIQRCDELLKKHPGHVQILITKLQLQAAIHDATSTKDTLAEICSAKIPPADLSSVSTIEEAVVELQSHTYPPALTAGPEIAKLWDGASKATTNVNHKLDLQSLRFTRAILDNRLQDAQHSLIQLKAISPKNRVFYMAHAALTQLLSSAKDDLQSRLALSLARKAVTEKFDEEASLDCRVPGQIFASQSSQSDLDSIKGRRFADSKQVFEAMKARKPADQRSAAAVPTASTVAPKAWLLAELTSLKDAFRVLVSSEQCSEPQLVQFAGNAVRLFDTAAKDLALRTYRPVSEAVFLAVSAIVKAWTINPSPAYLLQAAFITDCLLRLQPKVHEAKVILVHLYMRLGVGSLAYKEWDDLSIKEIQYDTWGHVFLSRISTVHPHKLIDIDPPRIITHALGVYGRIEDKLAETHASILSHGQTGMIFDLSELRSCLRLSITRRLLSLQQRRLARFYGKAADEKSISVQPRLTAAWLDLKDNRDFSAAFNHGFNLERTLHAQDDVQSTILFSLAADSLWCILHNQLPLVADTSELLAAIDKITTQPPLRDHELVAGEAIASLLRAAHELEQAPKNANVSSTVNEAIESLHVDDLAHDTQTLPLRADCVYLYIDTLRIVSAFTAFAAARNILGKDDAKAAQTAAATAFANIQKYCKSQLERCNASSIRQSMGSGTVDKKITSLDADHLDNFFALLAASCKDAWAGAAQYRL